MLFLKMVFYLTFCRQYPWIKTIQSYIANTSLGFPVISKDNLANKACLPVHSPAQSSPEAELWHLE